MSPAGLGAAVGGVLGLLSASVLHAIGASLANPVTCVVLMCETSYGPHTMGFDTGQVFVTLVVAYVLTLVVVLTDFK